jgi:hypothetical protein
MNNENAELKLDPNDPLDRIAIEARGGEQDAQAAEEAILNPNPEPVIDPAQTWAQIPRMLGGLLAMAMPELAKVYTDEKCLAWGQGMAAVSDKYGWDAADTIAKWGPEIALGVATLPLALPTIAAIRARRAQPAQQPEKDIDPAETQATDDANPMHVEPGGFSVPA